MKEVDQIVVPFNVPIEAEDLAENLSLSLKALEFLILVVDNDASVYNGSVTPMHAVGEYVGYLKAIANTLYEVLAADRKEGSTDE
jgi:hypothetical protein